MAIKLFGKTIQTLVMHREAFGEEEDDDDKILSLIQVSSVIDPADHCTEQGRQHEESIHPNPSDEEMSDTSARTASGTGLQVAAFGTSPSAPVVGKGKSLAVYHHIRVVIVL
ncbi:hypothetical protein KSP39_PZI015115 [Platanthera zijinensis]|uniref:Uncharacterized protein n=1 Tax=Platanthera zijinensis TaxID=2320716 RepID=A0AAP0G2B2_9ASPA